MGWTPWCLYYCVWTRCALKSYELYTSGTVPDIGICTWQRLCPQITHDTVTKRTRVATSFLRTLLKWRQSTLQFYKKVLNFARNSYCFLSFQKVIWSAQKLHEFLEYLWYIWVCVTCVDCVTGIFPSTLYKVHTPCRLALLCQRAIRCVTVCALCVWV